MVDGRIGVLVVGESRIVLVVVAVVLEVVVSKMMDD